MKELLEQIKKQATFVKEEDFDEVFDSAWQNVKKSFDKLEVEQYYACDIDEYYDDFVNGRYENLVPFFKDFAQSWPSIFEEKPDLIAKRLHLVTNHLTKYLEYEMYFYLLNEKGGESIRCLDIEKTKEQLVDLDDFMIFDEREIIINIHDNKGDLWAFYHLIDDSGLVKALLNEFKALFNQAEDYKKMARFDENLVNLLKAAELI